MGAYSTFKALFTVENGGGKNWNTSGLLWFPGLNRPRGGGASERSKATQCHLADVIWKTWRGDWKEFYRHFNGEKPLSAELAKVLTGVNAAQLPRTYCMRVLNLWDCKRLARTQVFH